MPKSIGKKSVLSMNQIYGRGPFGSLMGGGIEQPWLNSTRNKKNPNQIGAGFTGGATMPLTTNTNHFKGFRSETGSNGTANSKQGHANPGTSNGGNSSTVLTQNDASSIHSPSVHSHK